MCPQSSFIGTVNLINIVIFGAQEFMRKWFKRIVSCCERSSSEKTALDASIFKQTLNKRGWAIETMDPYTQEFVSKAIEAGNSKEWCAEIGAAFGFATIKALKKGAQMIATDIAPAHLEAIKSKVPHTLKKNLRLQQGECPQGNQIE